MQGEFKTDRSNFLATAVTAASSTAQYYRSGHRPFLDESPKYAELIPQLTKARCEKGLL
jgi:hypothetical protein